MNGDLLSHYFPDAQWAWISEGDYSTLEWFGPGNKPTETELAALPWPVSLVPQAVTPLQMRRALREAGLTSQVNALLATLDEETVETWEYALEIQRANPLIAMAAVELELDTGQVDDLFRLAATL